MHPLDPARGEDTLSRVLLAESAVLRWAVFARAIALDLSSVAPDPTEIPDELARVEADGSLWIFVILRGGLEVGMRVEPSEWEWGGQRHQ